MKVLAINGSPRKNGNTHQMLEAILEAAGEDVDKKVIFLKDYHINPCDGCYSCQNSARCHIEDEMEKILDKMVKADVIIVGSPVYYGSVTPEVRILCDRVGFVSQGRLEGKIGVAVTIARRWGHINAMMQIVAWFLNLGMLVVGPGDGWCSATAKEIGDFEKDKEGVEIAEKMGVKIRKLLNKLFEQGVNELKR